MIDVDITLNRNDKLSIIRYHKLEEDSFYTSFDKNIEEGDIKNIKKRIGFRNMRINNRIIKKLIVKEKTLKKNIDKNPLICPLCCGLFIYPVLSSCSHTYCRVCLLDYITRHNECAYPNCNKPIQQNKYLENKTIARFVKYFVEKKLTNVSQTYYLYRLRRHKKYLKKKKLQISNLKFGSEINIRNSYFKWERAIILEIRKIKNITLGGVVLKREMSNNFGDNTMKYINLESDSVSN